LLSGTTIVDLTCYDADGNKITFSDLTQPIDICLPIDTNRQDITSTTDVPTSVTCNFLDPVSGNYSTTGCTRDVSTTSATDA